MNIHTARLLMPIERRQDQPQERLTWLPKELYEPQPIPQQQERT